MSVWQGDSGGPMLCKFNGKRYFEGATSWGHGCTTPDYDGVYAKVRYLKDWVQNTETATKDNLAIMFDKQHCCKVKQM